MTTVRIASFVVNNSANAIAYSNMALCKIKQKKFEEAVQDAGRAIVADSKYLKGFYRRATANLKLGKRVEACLDFKRILEMEEDNAQVKKELEKVRAKLNPADRKIVDEFNEGFKRVEIEEEEDSEEEPEKAETTAPAEAPLEKEQPEHPKQKEPQSEADKAIEGFVEKLKAKKERMTKEIKAGLFEGCMAELTENISEAEEQRKEHFGLDQYHVGYTLLNRKKLGKAKVDKSVLDAWIEVPKLGLPPASENPNLIALVELELSLKSNLCYCFKQIGQAKFLCFLASNILQLCGAIMKGQGHLAQKASMIFQKTLKRRALGLEQNEDWTGSFRDFWVARTFDAMDSVIIKGLNRTKGGMEGEVHQETRRIETDFNTFLKCFREKEESKETMSESPKTETPTKTEKDQLTSSVFERVPHEDENSQSSDQKAQNVSIPTSPEKQEQKEKTSPTKTSAEQTTKFTKKIEPESSVVEVNLNSLQLEQLRETKLAGNSCFKTRDFEGAVHKFSEVIHKVFKAPVCDFLQSGRIDGD